MSKPEQATRSILEAAIKGDLAALEAAVAQGGRIDGRDPEHDQSALFLAVMFGRAAVAGYLVRSGANVNDRDDQQRTPLMVASIKTAPLLIENGADRDARDVTGATALIKAATRCDRDMIRLLLSYGANAGLKTNDGQTAVDIAEEFGLTDVVEQVRRIS